LGRQIVPVGYSQSFIRPNCKTKRTHAEHIKQSVSKTIVSSVGFSIRQVMQAASKMPSSSTPHILSKADLGATAAKWCFVRTADLHPAKKQHDGRMSGLVKLHRSAQPLSERQLWADLFRLARCAITEPALTDNWAAYPGMATAPLTCSVRGVQLSIESRL